MALNWLFPHPIFPRQAELDAVLPCGEGDDIPDDWDERVQRASLPLMRQCLRETMRLWPIAALGVMRTVDCEVRFRLHKPIPHLRAPTQRLVPDPTARGGSTKVEPSA